MNVPNPLEIPIQELGLPTVVERALLRHGMRLAGEVALLQESDLLQIHGVNRSTARLVRRRLREAGVPAATFGGIDPVELDNAFTALEAEIPEPWELNGVVYHGPNHPCPWIAFLWNNKTGETGGPEGCGETPLEALADLRARLGELA
jgi:hypothetical protein